MMTMEQLIREYGGYIYNYAYKLTCHPMDAEDLAQETLISAWKNLERLKSEYALKKWLSKICYNQFLMNLRKKARHPNELIEDFVQLEQEGKLLIDRLPGPEEEVQVAAEIRELQNGCFYAMVRKLTLNQRIVFSLMDMYGMSIEDVAVILDTSISATKGLLYRARMNIDSFFGDHCNLIHMQNPCSCKAWIEFSQNRSKLQQTTKKFIEYLDYKDKEYQFNQEVRSKVKLLYGAMPDKKPDDNWYYKVIQALTENEPTQV